MTKITLIFYFCAKVYFYDFLMNFSCFYFYECENSHVAFFIIFLRPRSIFKTTPLLEGVNIVIYPMIRPGPGPDSSGWEHRQDPRPLRSACAVRGLPRFFIKNVKWLFLQKHDFG